MDTTRPRGRAEAECRSRVVFHARLKELSAQTKGPDTGSNVSRSRGNSSNVKPGPWQTGQFKERAGFLVSRSLTGYLINSIFSKKKVKAVNQMYWECGVLRAVAV